jgi:phage tail-like protein
MTDVERNDPYRRHRFAVDVGDDGPPLGFSAVRGLAVRVQARPDDEKRPDWRDWGERLARLVGGRPSPPRRRTASPHLTLQRGVTGDRRLWDWLRDWVGGTTGARDVRVFLLDQAGDPARGWVARDATPVRWRGPELVADRPAVATESLELAHEGVEAIDDLRGDRDRPRIDHA